MQVLCKLSTWRPGVWGNPLFLLWKALERGNKDMRINVKCKEHPKYKGVHFTGKCNACDAMYDMRMGAQGRGLEIKDLQVKVN